MTATDYQLEQLYKEIGDRPQRKFEETLTSWDRNIFYYDRDEVSRQAENAARSGIQTTTYEDHRKVVETSVNLLRKSTTHEIAMAILTHRYFADYRANTFSGQGDFVSDYSFIIKRVGALFSSTTSRVKPSSVLSRLSDYSSPTLVQINHIAGIVKEVNLPEGHTSTLQEWANKLSQGAPESTTYMVAGLTLGV